METAQTADYALLTLLELERSDGQTVSQLAAALSLNRTVAQRIVTTLHRRAAVSRDLEGRYWLGPLLIALAERLPHELSIVSAPLVGELARRAQETVVVAARDGAEAVVVARENGSSSPLRVEYEVGFRQPINRGASSLAILAHLDEATARRHVAASDLPALAKIREQGYARSEGQLRAHMVGIAAPILAGELGVVGSIAIIVPSARATRLEGFLDDVVETAARIGRAYRQHDDAVDGMATAGTGR
ncbi:IclR family transcriptional regulator [Georgenia ruanii]|uniref:Helix-turn-helix domain-containing protein n=1 Tax=Georgenia ruanii TaxID=348442 RepID=A0A7J9UY10_9MICO|nr:IclR family transcriptional regulator C-terminal domain-containing protein [Georgenia ruanii]MPV89352.1 hypothetical protein [Georgenia ruanii]